MFRKLITPIVALSLLAAPTLLLAQESAAPETALGGLQLVKQEKYKVVYADPDADWTVYSKIILDDATVAFRKDWMRDKNRTATTLSSRVSTSDMERIKEGLSELFGEVFVEELETNGGFEIVSEADEDVLRIHPKITELDVYAPDTRSGSRNRTYTDQAGQMTLTLELYDSVTGDLLLAAAEHRATRDHGFMQYASSTSNRADARALLKSWANALTEALVEATGK